MVQRFVLYDYLKIYDNDSKIDHKKLAIELSQLSYEHAKTIMVIIIHYNELNGGCEAIPFGGFILTKDRGVRYSNIGNIPKALLHIIINYINMAKKLNN